MGRKIKIDKYSILLIVVILIAGLLRFIGTKPGFHQFHSDESTINSTATSFIKNKNFEPYRYEYPALTNIISARLLKVL